MPHTALGKDQYCYASSPIRRYVDIVNQRFLKAILLKDWYDIALTKQIDTSEIVEQQNYLQKGAKRQSRDDFLLAQIAAAASASKSLEGIVFDVGESIKIYVPAWKRIVKVRTWTCDTPTVGDQVTLKYFYNPDQISWKNKIVFALCS
jgi:exoribonuclease R